MALTIDTSRTILVSPFSFLRNYLSGIKMFLVRQKAIEYGHVRKHNADVFFKIARSIGVQHSLLSNEGEEILLPLTFLNLQEFKTMLTSCTSMRKMALLELGQPVRSEFIEICGITKEYAYSKAGWCVPLSWVKFLADHPTYKLKLQVFIDDPSKNYVSMVDANEKFVMTDTKMPVNCLCLTPDLDAPFSIAWQLSRCVKLNLEGSSPQAIQNYASEINTRNLSVV